MGAAPHDKMATRRQRAKQRQPQPPEPAADYEHIGVVLRLRPLLRWERREGFREAVAKTCEWFEANYDAARKGH